MDRKAPEGRHAVRCRLMPPLRGFKTRFDHELLGLAPQAIRCRRSAADVRKVRSYSTQNQHFGKPLDGKGQGCPSSYFVT
jgi:hypothetical protein